MPATDHPVFVPPSNLEIPLWRYMDFTKYAWMLDKQALFFSRADRFDDPLEGSLSAANPRLRPEIYGKALPEEAFKQVANFMRWARQWTFLNCWHMSEYESAAMWRLYAKTNEAIAVRTTFRKLKDTLPLQSYLGVVQYVDYDSHFIPEGNSMSAYMHKRRSYEHEREVRALITDLPTVDGTIQGGTVNPAAGREVPVGLNELIEQVFVAPTSPDWFFELVVNLTRKYGLSAAVGRSELDRAPIF